MKILNFGSLNLDYTYNLEHIVKEGETITSTGLSLYPGGKGLNQSVALGKAGAQVFHAGMVGEDGELLRNTCKDNNVNIDYLETANTRSGNAIIQLDKNGQNSIILYSGANRQITEKFVDKVLSNFEKEDILLIQNEINCIKYIIDSAYAKGMKIVMNPSPYNNEVTEYSLEKITLFVLNEIEGGQITNESKPDKIMAVLKKKFPNSSFVLTLGEKGAIFEDNNQKVRQDIIKTKVVDTTGAGDTFTGFFLYEFFSTNSPTKALEIATMAASIAVSRKGAAISIPTMAEVKQCLSDYKQCIN